MCTLQDKVLPLASARQHVLFKKRRKSGFGETMVRRQSGRKSSLAALVLRKLLLEDFKRPQIDGVSWRVPENGGPQRLKWPSEAIVCEGRSYCARHCREGRCNTTQGKTTSGHSVHLHSTGRCQLPITTSNVNDMCKDLCVLKNGRPFACCNASVDCITER